MSGEASPQVARPEWVSSTRPEPKLKAERKSSVAAAPVNSPTRPPEAAAEPAPPSRRTEREDSEKAAEAQREADREAYDALSGLLAILREESVVAYTRLSLPFAGAGTPEPRLGCTSEGLLLDLSKGAVQRLVTPWGTLPLRYALCFQGYQEPEPSELARELAPRQAAYLTGTESVSLFLSLDERPAQHLLGVRKVSGPRFAVSSVLGAALPIGELVDVDAGECVARCERWERLAHGPQPRAALRLAAALPTKTTPVLNELLGRTEAVRAELLPLLKRQKAVASARIPPAEEDLIGAMRRANNDVEKAAWELRSMRRSEDSLVSQRQGHVTRAQVREALRATDYDIDAAGRLLDQRRQISRVADYILDQRGLESGIGWPTRQEVEGLLARTGNDEGAVLSSLLRERRATVEKMVEIIHTDSVDKLLAVENLFIYGLTVPPTASERAHVEALYGGEFDRSAARLDCFLREVGALQRNLDELAPPDWRPSRAELEGLVRELGGAPAEAFLRALRRLAEAAPKLGSPDRETLGRYVRLGECDEEASLTFAQSVWKLMGGATASKAKEKPKSASARTRQPPAKAAPPPRSRSAAPAGKKRGGKGATASAPDPADTPGPSRAEAEAVLLAVNPVGDLTAATELLKRVDVIHRQISATFPLLRREDALWAASPAREARYLSREPLSQEERKEGESGAKHLLRRLGAALESLKDILAVDEPAEPPQSKSAVLAALAEADARSAQPSGVPRQSVREGLDAHAFNLEGATRWVRGVGSLLHRQAELGIESREEVEAAFEDHGQDPDQTTAYMEQLGGLMATVGASLPRVGRADAKAFLKLGADCASSAQLASLTTACLRGLSHLLGDAEALLSIGVKANALTADDRCYLIESLHRFAFADEARGGDGSAPSTSPRSTPGEGDGDGDGGSDGNSGGDGAAGASGEEVRTMVARAIEYMRKVSEVQVYLATFPELDQPSRVAAANALDAAGLDRKKAGRALRDELRKKREKDMREAYNRKRLLSEAYKKGRSPPSMMVVETAAEQLQASAPLRPPVSPLKRAVCELSLGADGGERSKSPRPFGQPRQTGHS